VNSPLLRKRMGTTFIQISVHPMAGVGATSFISNSFSSTYYCSHPTPAPTTALGFAGGWNWERNWALGIATGEARSCFFLPTIFRICEAGILFPQAGALWIDIAQKKGVFSVQFENNYAPVSQSLSAVEPGKAKTLTAKVCWWLQFMW